MFVTAESSASKTVRGRGRASITEIYPEILAVSTSSVAAGVWTRLAFFPATTRGSAAMLCLSFACCFAVFFLAAVVTSGFWIDRSQNTRMLRMQLARCSMATIVLVLFLPEYLSRVHPPVLRSALLLAITSILWLSLAIATIRQQSASRWQSSAIVRVALAALACLFVLVTALAIRKYYVFGYVGQDLAYFGQITYTTLHGHLFWGNLLQDLIYSRPVITDFAGHNSPLMFLFLPFYALAPTPITLLILRNIALFATVVPVFLIARRQSTTGTSCLWAAAFLLTPAILYQSIFDFYPLSFVALPLLFALYFYLEQRYTSFLVSIIATLLVREDLVFFVFGIGLIALWHRRSARWTIIPVVLATVWAVLSFRIILPAALHGATFVTDACFSHLGHSPQEMLQNVMHHPVNNVLVHGNIVYLKTLLTATALIASLGSPITLLCLPFLAINLLAGAGRCITTVIFAQYSVVPATLIFAGALLTMTRTTRTRLLSRVGRLGLRTANAPPLLLIALGCASLVFVTEKPQVEEFQQKSWGLEATQVVHLIPAGSSVAAPRYMLPHLANRDCLYQTHRLLEYHSAVFEYIILDSNWNRINAAGIYQYQYEKVARDAVSNASLITIYKSADFRVLRNPALRGQTCIAQR